MTCACSACRLTTKHSRRPFRRTTSCEIARTVHTTSYSRVRFLRTIIKTNAAPAESLWRPQSVVYNWITCVTSLRPTADCDARCSHIIIEYRPIGSGPATTRPGKKKSISLFWRAILEEKNRMNYANICYHDTKKYSLEINNLCELSLCG